jgi:hypothetical protein
MAPGALEPCGVPGVLDLPVARRQKDTPDQRPPSVVGKWLSTLGQHPEPAIRSACWQPLANGHRPLIRLPRPPPRPSPPAGPSRQRSRLGRSGKAARRSPQQQGRNSLRVIVAEPTDLPGLLSRTVRTAAGILTHIPAARTAEGKDPSHSRGFRASKSGRWTSRKAFLTGAANSA